MSSLTVQGASSSTASLCKHCSTLNPHWQLPTTLGRCFSQSVKVYSRGRSRPEVATTSMDLRLKNCAEALSKVSILLPSFSASPHTYMHTYTPTHAYSYTLNLFDPLTTAHTQNSNTHTHTEWLTQSLSVSLSLTPRALSLSLSEFVLRFPFTHHVNLKAFWVSYLHVFLRNSRLICS